MTDTWRFPLVALFAGLCALGGPALAQNDERSCIDGSGDAAMASCKRALAAAPRDRSLSLAFAEHLSQAGRDEEALQVLRSALERYPDDGALLNKLAIVESNLREKQWVEQRDDTKESRTRLSVKQKLARIRCEKRTGESALEACDELLLVLPDEADIHARRGFLLIDLGRPDEALPALRSAKRLGSSDPRVQARLKVLEQEQAGKKQVLAERLIFDPVQGTYRLQ